MNAWMRLFIYERGTRLLLTMFKNIEGRLEISIGRLGCHPLPLDHVGLSNHQVPQLDQQLVFVGGVGSNGSLKCRDVSLVLRHGSVKRILGHHLVGSHVNLKKTACVTFVSPPRA